MLLFRQLFDQKSSTYSYILADDVSKDAIIIDPVVEQTERDMTLIRELGLHLRLSLETHIHADHISGAYQLREALGCNIFMPANCYADCADHIISAQGTLSIGEYTLLALATPGHTDHHLSYVIEGYVFTGDTLLIRGCGRADFTGGDAGQLFDSVHQTLFALPDDTLVYPAHNYQGLLHSTIGEEKKWNKRLANTSREAFIEHMGKLTFSNIQNMDAMVQANTFCGKPTPDA